MRIVFILRRPLHIYPRLLTTVYFILSRSPRPQAAKDNLFWCPTILQDAVKFQIETFLLFSALARVCS